LIVDESQNLEIGALEELRMLSNFQLGAYPLLQTLLLGQPEFRTLLLEHPELEQLRQRWYRMIQGDPWIKSAVILAFQLAFLTPDYYKLILGR
jgi:type II secretory pathway predicted ATPase ExeA